MTQDYVEVPIEVTKEILDAAVTCDPTHCAFKLAGGVALDKIIPDTVKHVRVTARNIQASWGGWRWMAQLPERAGDWIVNFDRPAGDPQKKRVRPTKTVVYFQKLRPSDKPSPERQKQVNERRRERIANGQAPREYNWKQRKLGVIAA